MAVRITPGQTIAGVSAIELREQFRRLRLDTFSPAALADQLVSGTPKRTTVILGLLQEGYLELCDEPQEGVFHYGSDDKTFDAELGLAPPGEVRLALSTLGLALANATASKPVRRATAERALAELLARVAEVHADENLAYDVGTLVLFGSYLETDREEVGDVDIAIDLVDRPLPPGMERRKWHADRVRLAEASGRVFRSFFAEVSWPNDEVMRRLRARSRILAFVDFRAHEEFLQTRAHKVIYKLSQ